MTLPASLRSLDRAQRHALLALHSGPVAIACLDALRRADALIEPTEESKLALTFQGLLTRQGATVLLSPRGRVAAELIARSIARVHDIHVVWFGSGHGRALAACCCGWQARAPYSEGMAPQIVAAKAATHQERRAAAALAEPPELRADHV